MSRTFALATTEYLQINTAAFTAYPFTMACWFNVNDITNNHNLIWVGDKDSDIRFQALTAAGGLAGDPVEAVSHHYGGGTVRRAVTSTSYSASTWHHACGTWAGTTDRKAYLNGGGEGTDTGSVSGMALHDATAIGGRRDSSDSHYADGSVAEVGIWDVVLSAAEISILAAGFSPALVAPDSLVFYAPLVNDEDRDIARGLFLTAFNTPTVSAHTRIYNRPPIASSFVTGITIPFGDGEGDIFLYTAANWSPTPTWFFEATLKAVMGSVSAQLYDLTDSAEVASSTVSTASTTFARVRSSAITLTNAHEYEVRFGSSLGDSGSARGAAIIGV